MLYKKIIYFIRQSNGQNILNTRKILAFLFISDKIGKNDFLTKSKNPKE